MPLLLIFVAGVLIVSAIRNTQTQLATELETDLPGFGAWALAIIGVGALGWVPGMRVISRWLLALVIVVLVVKNYSALFAGFAHTAAPQPTQGAITPAAAYAANPDNPQLAAGDVGTATAANINAVQPASVTSPFGAFDPAAFLTAFESGIGGFGGIA